jgi:hypothetical protein
VTDKIKAFETLNRLNSERCMKGFTMVAQFTFQPSRTYAQYDLAALVSRVENIRISSFSLNT